MKFLKESVNLPGRDKYKWLLATSQDESNPPFRIFLDLKQEKKEIKSVDFKRALSVFTKTGPFVKILVERNEDVCPTVPKFTLVSSKTKPKKGKSI